jgi:hypothetical protein
LRLDTQGPDFYDKMYLLKRGDPNQKVGEVTQSFLTVLTRHPDGAKHWLTPPPTGSRSSFRRTSLANWLTDTEYGAGHLLARVIVNRLWQHHLGRGIVATPSDFGTQGARPTHPELLDWLAGELIRGGWRLKPIHKLILTSSVYLQTSACDEVRLAADRDNLLWWRRPGRRLEAEVIRDSLLAVSGQLDATMFGAGTLDPNMKRRSIYFFVKRSQLVPMMLLFDSPDTLQDLALRSTTTVAPQALLMMNSPIVRGYAEGLARRAVAASSSSTDENVKMAYATALSRPPSEEELNDGREFITAQAAAYRRSGKSNNHELAVADYCQAIVSLNEFVFID